MKELKIIHYFPMNIFIFRFQIGQQRVANENTCITYCTTGVLLQKLVKEKSLIGYTHIILDEIHERNAEMDFLLIIVRKFLNTVSRNVKVSDVR